MRSFTVLARRFWLVGAFAPLQSPKAQATGATPLTLAKAGEAKSHKEASQGESGRHKESASGEPGRHKESRRHRLDKKKAPPQETQSEETQEQAPQVTEDAEVPAADPNAAAATDPNAFTPVGADPNAPAAQSEVVESVEVDPTPTPQNGWFGDDDPVFDRVLDQYTTTTVRPHTVNIYINHRNNLGIFDSPWDGFLGFDGGGLRIGLAARYGILDNLDVGIFRQNGTPENFDTYEFDGRYRIPLHLEVPVRLAVRGGISWFNEPEKNSAGFFAQVIADRQIKDRAVAGLSLAFHNRSSGPRKTSLDDLYTLGVAAFGDVRILDYLSLSAEITMGVLGFHENIPAITFGPKFVTHRHTFAIVVSNTKSFTTDSIITSTPRYEFKEWVLGFNISREL